jgi:hypothetical protein
MMPAQGLTLADSDDWRRVHRLDRLNRKKPAKLLDYQALTLIKGASRFGPVFFSFVAPALTLDAALEFSLIVSDDENTSVTDTIQIIVRRK